MLDVLDFIEDKGGDPTKIRESQRRRYAKEDVVDEVISMFEDHKKSELVMHGLKAFSEWRSLFPSTICCYPSRHENKRNAEGDRLEKKGRHCCMTSKFSPW